MWIGCFPSITPARAPEYAGGATRGGKAGIAEKER